jgi:hypothetical protein
MEPDFPWRREIRGTRLSWCTIREWCDLCERVGSPPSSSTPARDRARRVYASLTVADIRAATDIGALEHLERRLVLAKQLGWPAGWFLTRELSRASLGALLVEARNRIDALRSGRAANPRPKGPRFDPRRLPDAAIASLIQRHPDLDVVDRLRSERSRRREARMRAESLGRPRI